MALTSCMYLTTHARLVTIITNNKVFFKQTNTRAETHNDLCCGSARCLHTLCAMKRQTVGLGWTGYVWCFGKQSCTKWNLNVKYFVHHIPSSEYASAIASRPLLRARRAVVAPPDRGTAWCAQWSPVCSSGPHCGACKSWWRFPLDHLTQDVINIECRAFAYQVHD